MAGAAATVMSVLPFLFIDAIQSLFEKTDEASLASACSQRVRRLTLRAKRGRTNPISTQDLAYAVVGKPIASW